MTKRAPDKTAVGEDEVEDTGGGEANLSVSLSAKTPLQLTLTKTSLELLKSLAKVDTLVLWHTVCSFFQSITTYIHT